MAGNTDGMGLLDLASCSLNHKHGDDWLEEDASSFVLSHSSRRVSRVYAALIYV